MRVKTNLESTFARIGVLFLLLSASLALAGASGLAEIRIADVAGIVSLGVLSFVVSFGLFQWEIIRGTTVQCHGTDRQSTVAGHRQRLLIGGLWVLLIAFPFVVLTLKLSGIADGANFYDFGAYYNAAERFVHGYPLYDWTTTYPEVTHLPDSLNRYLYAPFTVFLFVPFILFPPGIAALVWTAFSIAVYTAGMVSLLRSLGVELPLRYWAALCASAVGFGPFVIVTIAGQVTGVITGLLCLTAASLASENPRSRRIHSAVFVMLPVVFKAYFAPVGVVLLRDWRRLAAAAVTGVAVASAGVLVFGIDSSVEFLTILSGGKGWGSSADPPSAWNLNEFQPLFLFKSVYAPVRVAVFAAVAGIGLYSRRFDFEHVDLYVLSIGILSVVLAAPSRGAMDLVTMVPVILFLLVTTHGRADGVFVSVLVATLLIHIHPYTIEFLTTFGSQLLGRPDVLFVVLPYVQPAAWGVLILTTVVVVEFARKTSTLKPD